MSAPIQPTQTAFTAPRERVTVYSKPNCVQCTMTVRYLNANDVPFEILDATEPENTALLASYGIRSAPGVFPPTGVKIHGSGAHLTPFGGFNPILLDAIKEHFARAAANAPTSPEKDAA